MTEIIAIISSVITALLSFTFGYRKASKESVALDLENLTSSIEIYKTVIEDLKKEIRFLRGKVDEMEKKVEQLLQENNTLKKSVSKSKSTSPTKS